MKESLRSKSDKDNVIGEDNTLIRNDLSCTRCRRAHNKDAINVSRTKSELKSKSNRRDFVLDMLLHSYMANCSVLKRYPLP